jgi:large subunit ribosomal protein L11
MEFCKQFNERTKNQQGLIVPVVITAYEDRSFTFVIKSPPASILLKKACSLAKGSGEPNRTKVGKVTRTQLQEIAAMKGADLNALTPAAAIRIIEGTARSMGIEVGG